MSNYFTPVILGKEHGVVFDSPYISLKSGWIVELRLCVAGFGAPVEEEYNFISDIFL